MARIVAGGAIERASADSLVKARHEGGGEERRKQVQNRHGDQSRDDHARQVNLPRMAAAQGYGLRRRAMAHRSKLEIFAPEEVSVQEEERGEADPGEKRQQKD
jgi:hypothetical protein